MPAHHFNRLVEPVDEDTMTMAFRVIGVDMHNKITLSECLVQVRENVLVLIFPARGLFGPVLVGLVGVVILAAGVVAAAGDGGGSFFGAASGAFLAGAFFGAGASGVGSSSPQLDLRLEGLSGSSFSLFGILATPAASSAASSCFCSCSGLLRKCLACLWKKRG